MLTIGQEACTSKTISESDVYLYAGITGDFNPIHINSEVSKNGIFGKRIVHGLMTAGLVSAVIGEKMGEGNIYKSQQLNFRLPVYFGDTVTARVIVRNCLNEKAGIYQLETVVVNQNGETVLDGEAIIKVCD